MASGGGKMSKGGSSKSRGALGQAEVVKKTVHKLTTPQMHVMTLRTALFDEHGVDKDVTEKLGPFLKYNRNGLDLTIEFAAGGNMRNHEAGKGMKGGLQRWAYDLAKANMKPLCEAAGEEWSDGEKFADLKDKAARFLIVREADGGAPVAFLHFRFTMQGEVFNTMDGLPCVLIVDVQLVESVRRKGLGQHLVRIVELIAHKQNMPYIMVETYKGDVVGRGFVTGKLKGYNLDSGTFRNLNHEDELEDEDEERPFELFSKCIDKKLMSRQREKENVHAYAQQLVAQMAKAKIADSKK